MRRYGLLLLGGVLTAISAVGAFTPVIWKLSGSPNEEYPELFVLFFVLPPSVALLIAGVLVAKRR